MAAVCYLNGVRQDEIDVDISDRAFNYGDGFFETMRLIINEQAGYFPLLAFHLQRIDQSGEVLGLEVSVLHSELAHILTDFQKEAPAGDYVCKLHVCREPGVRGYRGASAKVVSRVAISAKVDSHHCPGHRLTLCQHPLSRNPKLAGIKHLNRLDQVVARNEWDDEFDDGIMLNIQGRPVECTAHNLFWVKNNQIYTPDLSQEGVDGVVRRWLMENTNTISGCYSLQNLLDAQEVFITNALNGVAAVTAIGDNVYPVGAVTTEVQKQYQHWVLHPTSV